MFGVNMIKKDKLVYGVGVNDADYFVCRKENDPYCINLNGGFIDVVNDIEDAKIFVKNYLTSLTNDLMVFING